MPGAAARMSKRSIKNKRYLFYSNIKQGKSDIDDLKTLSNNLVIVRIVQIFYSAGLDYLTDLFCSSHI